LLQVFTRRGQRSVDLAGRDRHGRRGGGRGSVAGRAGRARARKRHDRRRIHDDRAVREAAAQKLAARDGEGKRLKVRTLARQVGRLALDVVGHLIAQVVELNDLTAHFVAQKFQLVMVFVDRARKLKGRLNGFEQIRGKRGVGGDGCLQGVQAVQRVGDFVQAGLGFIPLTQQDRVAARRAVLKARRDGGDGAVILYGSGRAVGA